MRKYNAMDCIFIYNSCSHFNHAWAIGHSSCCIYSSGGQSDCGHQETHSRPFPLQETDKTHRQRSMNPLVSFSDTTLVCLIYNLYEG